MIGSSQQRVVAVVDDEAVVRDAAANLLKSVGLDARCFESAEDFLQSPLRDKVACLLLDVRLKGMSGLQLQQQLISLGSNIPIVFMSGRHDLGGRMRAQALQAGAVAFLQKPFVEQELLAAMRAAIHF